ncbi:WD40/YVTN/BNR-like repeat-containing protein [Polyangium sorediatum]|uniref:Sialidase n=1 Tax=Polyangium sorediatum TaxID=889274 RepID=A0ABT6NWX1_9BACT|nr:exo-alpha-sialidase [Polyangium sorediatum]MDI1432813.1 hypothetical protein [Polyangium sorediatum]
MSSRLFVATRKGLFRLDRKPSGWSIREVSFLGDNVSMVLPDPRDGTLYAALALGHFGVKLRRSRDVGATWEEITAPAYPPLPEGAEPDKTPDGREWPQRVELLWSLEAGRDHEPGHLWCGTIPGGLFHSKDHGQSWDLVRSLWDHPTRKGWFGGGYDWPGIHSICVDRSGVTVGISCGGVWRSMDDGATWETRTEGMYAEYMPPERRDDPGIQDPHRVVACAAQPDALWVQHHNGLFRSTDGGKTWREVTSVKPSKFGFTMAVHPRDPETAWVVPAKKDEQRVPVDGKVVVARTRDGGASFTVLERGLPQGNAFDLTYRHGLDVDGSGNVLAFGTTTGSLWLSEDGGDSWQTISNHLPPVYAVRFAEGAADA